MDMQVNSQEIYTETIGNIRIQIMKWCSSEQSKHPEKGKLMIEIVYYLGVASFLRD